MSTKDITPEHLRCPVAYCPSVHELGDGSLLIIAAAGHIDEWNACLGRPIGLGETAVIANRELLDDYVRIRAAELGWINPNAE